MNSSTLSSYHPLLQGVESHLIHMREEMNKRYKEHNYLLEAMVIIYEWFFKREVGWGPSFILFAGFERKQDHVQACLCSHELSNFHVNS